MQVRDFVASARAGASRVCQMIMGQGKTTVIAPLLCLVLGDGKRLVMPVCPRPLLDMSRSVLRSAFCSIIQKKVRARDSVLSPSSTYSRLTPYSFPPSLLYFCHHQGVHARLRPRRPRE
jgi:hypothetical protein